MRTKPGVKLMRENNKRINRKIKIKKSN
jgi:hypothetical protein